MYVANTRFLMSSIYFVQACHPHAFNGTRVIPQCSRLSSSVENRSRRRRSKVIIIRGFYQTLAADVYTLSRTTKTQKSAVAMLSRPNAHAPGLHRMCRSKG